MRNFILIAVAAALGGCATGYQVAVMPRDTGKVYMGMAEDPGSGEGRMSITIENKTYSGTWVHTTPERTSGWISGGFGFGFGRWGRHGWGTGGLVTMDNPQGSEAKALLTAADGSGMRCDLRTGQGFGGGTCRDDRGREYDVQLRPGPARG